MPNIYQKSIEKVEQGSRFKVDFQHRSLKIDGKFVIKNGKYEGDSGIKIPDNPLEEIEKLFRSYQHSIPSARSESKRKPYFRALPEHELTDDDMLYGCHREPTQLALELYVLMAIIENKLHWNQFAEGKWFWQSTNHPSLIILKNWIINN